jgi:hypothetical protein
MLMKLDDSFQGYIFDLFCIQERHWQFSEHLIAKHIMSHADTHNILYPLQHGFHTGRSCETQLLEFIDDVTLNMENGKQTDMLVMDFLKAFDCQICYGVISN